MIRKRELEIKIVALFYDSSSNISKKFYTESL